MVGLEFHSAELGPQGRAAPVWLILQLLGAMSGWEGRLLGDGGWETPVAMGMDGEEALRGPGRAW